MLLIIFSTWELRNKSNPLNMDYGEYIFFDPRCLHCTQYNDTEITRISMDIRIITESNLKKYSREKELIFSIKGKCTEIIHI